MSCNGCRVLRKGCSDSCALRPCLQWIDAADAQGHATVFVAKFFGRAGLLSFISAVPEPQRPDLFRSLLYEAAGRTINPVHGAAGLMGAGAWHLCQEAVDTVLRGGAIAPMPDLRAAGGGNAGLYGGRGSGKRAAAAGGCSTFSAAKRVRVRVRKQPAADDAEGEAPPCDLGLCLSSPGSSPPSAASSGRAPFLRRPGTPSVTSDDSVTTTTTTTTRTTTRGGREDPAKAASERESTTLAATADGDDACVSPSDDVPAVSACLPGLRAEHSVSGPVRTELTDEEGWDQRGRRA